MQRRAAEMAVRRGNGRAGAGYVFGVPAAPVRFSYRRTFAGLRDMACQQKQKILKKKKPFFLNKKGEWLLFCGNQIARVTLLERIHLVQT